MYIEACLAYIICSAVLIRKGKKKNERKQINQFGWKFVLKKKTECKLVEWI